MHEFEELAVAQENAWIGLMGCLPVCRYVDYISIMAYDYYGPWSSTLGHQSPLYVPQQDRDSASASLLSQVQYKQSFSSFLLTLVTQAKLCVERNVQIPHA